MDSTVARAKRSHSVLVVDNDAGVCEALVDYLEADGYAAQSATNGREALEFLRAGGSGRVVVLLDLIMPVMDGWSFCEALTAEERQRTTVVIVSAVTEDLALPPLAKHVLRKPIGLEELDLLMARFGG